MNVIKEMRVRTRLFSVGVALAAAGFALLSSQPAEATITANPATVSLAPGQGPVTVNVTLTFPPISGCALFACTGSLIFNPASSPGIIISPANPTFTLAFTQTTATTSFQVFAQTTAVRGTIPFTLSAAGATLNAGTGAFIVNIVSFTGSVSPSPVTLIRDDAPVNITVSTQADPGFSPTLGYTFSGFPAGIAFGAAQFVRPPFPNLTFAASATVAAGTYTGFLVGSYGGQLGLVTKNFPVTVVVVVPDISGTFSPPVVSACPGGVPGQTKFILTPLNGFAGTPTVVVASAPPGITVTPSPLVVPPLPPTQTLSLTVNAAPGAQSGVVTLNISYFSRTLIINKNVTFNVTVPVPDYTQSVSPGTLNLIAGGAASPFAASLTALPCFVTDVQVDAKSTTPGLTVTPGTAFLTNPGFAPAFFNVQAGAGVPTGRYPVTFTFSTKTGAPRIVTVFASVTNTLDFTLAVTSPVTLQAGGSGTATVTATGVGGFSGAVTVTVPQSLSGLPGVTLSPGTLNLTTGVPQAITVQATLTAPPGTATGILTGIAPTLPLVSHTASLTVIVTAAPDFTIQVTPPSSTIAAGGSGSISVSATALNGFAGSIAVTAPSIIGTTFSPASFSLAPGSSQTVSVAVDPSAPGGPHAGDFTGTALTGKALMSTHTATYTVVVILRPPVITSVAPSAIFPGSAPVVVTVSGSDFQPGATLTTTAADLGISGVTFVSSTSIRFTATLGASALAGSRNIFVRNPDGQTSNAGIIVAKAAPVITSITPPAVSTGTRSSTLTLTGLNFEPGAVVTVRPRGAQALAATGPDVTVESTTVLSPTLANVSVTVRADALPGPYLLDLRNPDGGVANKGATLIVGSSDSISAPVGVTAAAIVSPLPGQLLSLDKPVYAKGVIATTGIGSIIGTWLFDGIAFDRFAVTASAGFPVELYSHIPIPTSWVGSHTVQLAIESPQMLVTPEVQVIQSVESQTKLRILSPADGTIVGRTLPLLRWTLVPGGSGYEIEFLTADGRTRERLVRLSVDSWIPSPKDLAELGPGVHLWHVRTIFPANVDSTWTPARRLIVLPEQVALALAAPGIDPKTSRGLLKWTGGAPGLLYRVDFFKPGQMQPGFSALTARAEYVLPPGSPWGAPDVLVRVTAFGADGLPRGVSGVVAIPRNAFRREPSNEFRFAQSAPSLASTTPKDGETVPSTTPAVGAAWTGSVAREDVALFVDTTDVTQVSQLTPTSISYTALVPLPPGVRAARLSLAGKVTAWSFTIPADAPGAPAPAQPVAAGGAGAPADQTQPPPATGAEAAAPQPPAPAVRTEWVLTALGTVTLVRAQNQPDVDQGRLQVTGQMDLATASGAFDGKATADIVGRHDFTDPHNTVNESRNWLLKAGANQAGGFREEATVGYSAPAFLDQAQIMTTGLARGGVLGKAQTPWVSASYYETFDPRPAGVVAGTFGPEQKVKAAALEAPGDPGRFVLRGIAFQVEDQPGSNSAGGKGKLWGGFGKYVLSPALTILAEGAHGEFTPNEGSAEGPQSGNAFRLGLMGAVGTFSYTLNALHTDANFVNPANRGFTPGGVADRTGGDVALNKTFGPLTAGLQYRHIEGGNSSGSTLPKSKEDGGGLNLSMPILPWFTAAATGNITKSTGDADAVHSTPETDRTQKAVNLTLTETAAGKFTFSEGLSYQELRDAINSASDQTVKMAMISGSGLVLPNLNLSLNLSGTRSASAPTVGTTDQFLVSVQPALTIPQVFTTITPRAAYTRSKNDVSEIVSQSEQYQLMAQFAPTWINSMFAIQLAADWSRARTSMDTVTPDYTHRYVITITLRWGANYKMGEAPPPPPPPPQVGQQLPLLPPLKIGARPATGPAPGASILPPAGGGL